jgi:hypothetical protein
LKPNLSWALASELLNHAIEFNTMNPAAPKCYRAMKLWLNVTISYAAVKIKGGANLNRAYKFGYTFAPRESYEKTFWWGSALEEIVQSHCAAARGHEGCVVCRLGVAAISFSAGSIDGLRV